MKSVIAIAIVFVSALGGLAAQPRYAQVLRDVEEGSPLLQAARKRAEAQSTAAQATPLLDALEATATWYRGDPTSIGNRWDFSVSQSVEMPTQLVRRARLRTLEQQSATLDYETLRNATLLEAQQTCAELIYWRGVAQVYARRSQGAVRIAQLYEQRYRAGDCSVLDYNSVQLYLAQMQSRFNEVSVQADHAQHDLALLTGSEDYVFAQTEYDSVVIEPSFDAWYSQVEMHNPDLRILDNRLEAERQQQQLDEAGWLPTLQVGYASENYVGEAFRGVQVGLTLPLWNQHRRARAAALAAEAAQQELSAQRKKWYTHQECMYHRQLSLRQSLNGLQQALARWGSMDLLTRALDAGEIDLEMYLQRADEYYEVELQIWEMAFELEQLHLRLHSITL